MKHWVIWLSTVLALWVVIGSCVYICAMRPRYTISHASPRDIIILDTYTGTTWVYLPPIGDGTPEWLRLQDMHQVTIVDPFAAAAYMTKTNTSPRR